MGLYAAAGVTALTYEGALESNLLARSSYSHTVKNDKLDQIEIVRTGAVANPLDVHASHINETTKFYLQTGIVCKETIQRGVHFFLPFSARKSDCRNISDAMTTTGLRNAADQSGYTQAFHVAVLGAVEVPKIEIAQRKPEALNFRR